MRKEKQKLTTGRPTVRCGCILIRRSGLRYDPRQESCAVIPLAGNRIPAPKTLLVHRDNVNRIIPALALPCVLKQPDSSFSLSVVKVETEEELPAKVNGLLDTSELIVAQEYLPTEFDWRVGILDRRP